MANNAKIVPRDIYTQAGLPLPHKGKYSEPAATVAGTNPLKEGIRSMYRDIDKAQAIRRFVWHNLPAGLTSDLIETVLYYKGQGAFFYIEELDKFFFLPYTLATKNGTGLDEYGRYKSITPIPLAGGAVDENGKVKPLFPGRIFDVDYDVVLPEDLTYEHLTNHAVIIRDYAPSALSQFTEPRAGKQEAIIDVMSDCVPLMRTALVNGVGITGVKVRSQDEQVNVDVANNQVQNAAINGQKYVGIINGLDMQELNDARSTMMIDQYTRALASLDNIRVSAYGIPNGGVYEKAEHMLQDEQDLASGRNSLVFEDALAWREHACLVINSKWPLGMWVEDRGTQQMDAFTDFGADSTENNTYNEGGSDNDTNE